MCHCHCMKRVLIEAEGLRLFSCLEKDTGCTDVFPGYMRTGEPGSGWTKHSPAVRLGTSDSAYRATGGPEEHLQHCCRSLAGQHALLLRVRAESLCLPLQSPTLLRASLPAWEEGTNPSQTQKPPSRGYPRDKHAAMLSGTS